MTIKVKQSIPIAYHLNVRVINDFSKLEWLIPGITAFTEGDYGQVPYPFKPKSEGLVE